MKKYILALSLMLGFNAFEASSQTIDKEATYKITGKSKRGRLANVEQKANGDYELTYLTKSTARKAKFQIYTFDKDFNFKNLEDGELEYEKMKTKFKWFKFNGELYSVEAITLNWNPAAPLKLKKKRITYKYDWLLLGYHKKVEVLEKVKPRTDDGMKYFAKGYMEDEITGDIYIIAGAAPGMVSKDAGQQLTDLRLLKFDYDLNKVAETKIPFEYGQEVAFSQAFANEDPNNPEAKGVDGGVIVFAPTVWKGSSAPKDKNKGNFTYVEFDKDLNLIGRESFTSPSPGWKIETAVWTPNASGKRDVYVYGSAAFGKDKYYNVAVQSAKKKSIQMMKVSSGKIQYLTESNLEDLAAKKVTPPSVKKTQDYNGKQAVKGGYELLGNGGILVMGQFYDKEGKGKDFYGIQFDKDGNLEATYGVDLTKSNAFKTGNPYSFMNKGQNVYMEVIEIAGSASMQFYFPTLTKIDVNAKKVSDPLVLGLDGKKQKYFIDKSYPRLNVSEKQIVYFGSDKGGKTIWFSRVNLD